jgi:TonB-linked SusC/RagA family outer membrane protein
MVSASDLVNFNGAWEQNSETFDSYLQGKIAGVQITRKSGTPSMGANVNIRGFNSLYTNNQPLYILDGVIYNAEIHSSSITQGHENNPLQNIDVRDIQNVTVLKDAVATAIYGTKAANGVIIINTNHAKDYATKIDFSATTGINITPKNIPVMDSYNYRSYLNDILSTTTLSGINISNMPFNNDNTNYINYNVYHNETNWQNEIFKSSIDKNYYLKVTGGDNIAKYALSVGYANDNGIIDNTKQDKYTARFNGDLNLSKKLTAQTNISVGYGQQNLKDQSLTSKTNPIFLALTKAPFLNTNEVTSEGLISPNYADSDYFGFSNPMQIIHNGINSKKSYRFLGGVNFDYALTNNIKISNITGVTYDKAQENFFVPQKGIAQDTVNNSVVTSRLGAQVARYFSIYNDLKVNYNKVLNNGHKINTFVGVRYHHNDAEQDYALGFNSATDELVSIGNSSLALRTFGGNIGKWANITTYGLVDYSISDKYIINGSFSIDGSSRFGSKAKGGVILSNKAFGVFPAIGGAWILSSENFLREIENINLLKYRISYGLTGNDDIGNYNARQNYISQNLLGLQGLVREGIANPYLRWETVKKFNTGFDLSMFNERFNLSFDFYQNQTDKMLAYELGHTISGVGAYLNNASAMKTTGIDLSVFGRIFNKKLIWDASINLGKYKNEINSLPQDIYTSVAGATYLTKEGGAANLFYGYKFEGVYSTQVEANTSGLAILDETGTRIPFSAGDAKFIDKNNDKVIDANDRYVIGNPNPDFYGGINNSFSYKNWRLGALFTFSVGNDVYNYTRAVLESGDNIYNQTFALANRWKADGQETTIPKVSYGDPMGNARFSDRWIEDGSYLRLRQLSIEYQFNVNKNIIKYVRLYGTANNLFTFNKYLGYDPEFSMSSNIFNQGIDATLEPQFRSFQLGLRIGL